MQSVAYAPDWDVVGVWTIRFREKWNMVKIEAPKIGPVDRRSSDNRRQTKSKMAAIAAMLSKGTFLQLPPMSHQKIRPVDPGIGQKINGDQIQDGRRSGHLG
jgi:hypothetical protein